MKKIYENTYEKINLGDEGKEIYKYLLNYNLLFDVIREKISENGLSQTDFEILLYSFRFILNTQINPKDNFYNNILKSKTSGFISNNFIPGSFPIFNEFMKSFDKLSGNLQLVHKVGYYICKDCGYLYEVGFCTFPQIVDKCPSGHDIGGVKHINIKKDLRIFNNKEDQIKLKELWPDCEDWFNSSIWLTLQEFKEQYVDKNIPKPQKGIYKDYDVLSFEQNSPKRGMNIITFRLLNFILYSYLLGSYILDNLSKEELSD